MKYQWTALLCVMVPSACTPAPSGDAGAGDVTVADGGHDGGPMDSGLDVPVVPDAMDVVGDSGSDATPPVDAFAMPPDAGLTAGDMLFGYAALFCHDRDLEPDVGEDGYYGAIELPPTTASVHLTRAVYRTMDDPSRGCLGGAAHQFVLFSSVAESPPDARPTVVATLDIPAGSAVAGYRLIDQTFASPVPYNPGDHFFAAIHYGAHNATVCMPTCTTDPSPTWWSLAAAQPFAWARLASFGDNFRGHLGLWVVGRAP